MSLLRRRTAADTAAFDEFVAARSVALRRLALVLTGDAHLAEDAVQAALLSAWRRWDRVRVADDPDAYVRAVLVNGVRSEHRRKRPAEARGVEVPERAVADRVAALAERDAVWRGLRRLPAGQRAVLVLRFYEDLTEAETARVLGCHVGTVKSQTARALARLRADAELNPAVAGEVGP